LLLVLFLLLLPSLLLLANPPWTAQIDATAGLGGSCRAGRRGVTFPPRRSRARAGGQELRRGNVRGREGRARRVENKYIKY